MNAPSLDPLECGQSRASRIGFTLFLFLPALALVIFVFPKFEPIYRKLAAKGDVPPATECLVAAAHYDSRSYHLIPPFALLELIVLVEVIFHLHPQIGTQRILAKVWVALILLGVFCTYGLLLHATLAPVFKTSSNIG
jgi:type II secretory pathway component PulF